MSGTICQVLYTTSLALGSVTNVSLELSTSGVHTDNGLAICFMGANYNLSDPAATLSFSSGGDQFDVQSETTLGAVEANVMTFSSLLQQDNTFTSDQQFGYAISRHMLPIFDHQCTLLWCETCVYDSLALTGPSTNTGALRPTLPHYSPMSCLHTTCRCQQT